MLIHLAFPNHIVITTPQLLSATPAAGDLATTNDKSSLGDFLFLGASPIAAASPDFRTVAAAMFAEAVPGAASSGPPAHGPATSKKNGDAPASGSQETHDSKPQLQIASNFWQRTAFSARLSSAPLPFARSEILSKTAGADPLAALSQRCSTQAEIMGTYNPPASQVSGEWPAALEDSVPAASQATSGSEQSPRNYFPQLAQQAATQAISSSDNLRSTGEAAIGVGHNFAGSLPHTAFGDIPQSETGGLAAEGGIPLAVPTASGSRNTPPRDAQAAVDDALPAALQATDGSDQSSNSGPVQQSRMVQPGGERFSSLDNLASTARVAARDSDNVAESLSQTTFHGNVPQSGTERSAPADKISQTAATASGSGNRPTQNGVLAAQDILDQPGASAPQGTNGSDQLSSVRPAQQPAKARPAEQIISSFDGLRFAGARASAGVSDNVAGSLSRNNIS